jgi:hypothetical protein
MMVDKPKTINVNETLESIRFAQGRPMVEESEKLVLEADDLAVIAYYLDSQMGPKECSSTIPKKYYKELPNLDSLLVQQGIITMTLLGQGDTYTSGLYIIPCPKIFGERDKIVFGTTIRNPKDTDLRGKKAAYCIIETFFPKLFNNFFTNNKTIIENIFKNKFEKIENINQITDEILVDIKNQIIQETS